MPRYRVEHRYASSTHGPWVEGDHVELSEEEAEWVNHDSEGTLKLVDPQAQAAAKRERQAELEERRRAEQLARERREATERVHGISQSREPGRMDPGVSQADEPGRSPGGGQEEKAVPKREDTVIEPPGDAEPEAPAPKRRGRPPGSGRKAT
jgi:hypothetical protein